MTIKKYLLLMAGGSGVRMGADRPKQFLEIGGKAVLHHTLEKFVRAEPDLKTVIVLPEDWQEYWKTYCLTHNLVYPQTLVHGGITRFHSVKNGLAKVPDDALVAIHDGVRPLVSVELIRRLFSEAASCEGIIPVVPCVDTIKYLHKEENGILCRHEGETVDRSKLYGAQTPQIFQAGLLKKAYGQAYDPAFTDDASVAESYGMKIAYSEGERYNLKLTSRDDMKIAEILLG